MDQVTPPEPIPEPIIVGSSGTILVIDDDAGVNEVIVRSLQMLGHYTVITALDGVQGLASIMQTRPDCVIVDLIMPELDGYRLVQSVRGDPATTHIPIIILSALAQDFDRFKGRAVGADRYLTKPIRPLELVQAVREVLHITAAERDAAYQLFADQAEEDPHAFE